MVCTIRPAQLQDYGRVCQLFAGGDAFHARALPERFSSSEPARSETFFTHLQTSAEHQLLLAEAEHQPVGLLEFRVNTITARPAAPARRFVSIDSLIVKAAFQRLGIGRRLMHEAEQWAAAQAIATLELNVFAFNEPAIRLYQELAYSTLSLRLHKQLEP